MPQKYVESFELAKNRWSEMPELNVPRAGLSSCYLGDQIYAFAGMKENRKRLNSIERLRVVAVKPSLIVVPKWELIQPPKDKDFIPRSNPVIVAWNLTSIAILGGIDQEEKCLSDVVFYDTIQKTCTVQVTNDEKGQPKFSSAANQTALINRNEVVSLVDLTLKDDLTPSLISFKRDATQIKVIQKWPHDENNLPFDEDSEYEDEDETEIDGPEIELQD